MFKRLFKNTIGIYASPEDVKNLMIYKVSAFSFIFSFPIILLNFYYFFTCSLGFWAFIHLIPVFIIFIVLILFDKLGYNLKIFLLLGAYYLVGIVNLYLAGFSGVGIIFFIAISGISVLFLKPDLALGVIIFCIITLACFASLFTNKILFLQFDADNSNANFISWSIAIAIYMFLSIMFYLTYTVIESAFILNMKLSNNQQRELEIYNEKLKQLLDNERKYQHELLDTKLKAEESNKLKTEFLRNISHEIRTPLNGIVGFVKLLSEKNLTPEKRELYANIILKSSEKLENIVDSIIEISILESGNAEIKIQIIEIKEFFNDLLNIFRLKIENKKIDISYSVNIKFSFIYSDKEKLKKIMHNLLDNAIKFTNHGKIEFGIIEKDNRLEFYVIDTGIGISQECYDKIFEPFCQANSEISVKYGGLGVGLSIVKLLVNLLGAKLSFESELNKGSIFKISFRTTDLIKDPDSKY